MAEIVVRATFAGEPLSKGRPRVVRGNAYTPARTRQAEAAIRWQLRAVAPRLNERDELGVRLRFFSGTRRRRDLDNLVKLVLDACNGVVWADDAQVVALDASVERGVSDPRTELEVYVIDRARAAA